MGAWVLGLLRDAQYVHNLHVSQLQPDINAWQDVTAQTHGRAHPESQENVGVLLDGSTHRALVGEEDGSHCSNLKHTSDVVSYIVSTQWSKAVYVPIFQL